MKINYNNKKFRPIQNTKNAETSTETTFVYKQEGSILSSQYSGGKIIKGSLLGLVDDEGCIEMRYQQVNSKGELMTGKCNSRPEFRKNGKLLLHEEWEWTSGDFSKGSSILEEI